MLTKGLGSRLAVSLVFLIFSFATHAQQISNLGVFGGNIADPGNIPGILEAANAAGLGPFDSNFPPSPPYSNGRFSNGLVSPEYLAQILGVSGGNVANLAVGNAFSDQLPVTLAGGVLIGNGSAIPGPIGRGLFPLNDTDISSQVRQYLLANPTPGPDDLMLVYASVNDGALALNTSALLMLPPNEAAGVIQLGAITNGLNTASSALNLLLAGARQVVLVNLPDIGRTPAAAAGGLNGIAAGTAFSQITNLALADAASDLNDQFDAVVTVFDSFTLLNDIVANPGKYGLSDVTNPCLLVPDCAGNPAVAEGFLFWDPFYPTTGVHAITAAAIADTVNAPKTLASHAEVGRYAAEQFSYRLLSSAHAETHGFYASVDRLDWSRDGETFAFGYDTQLTRLTLGAGLVTDSGWRLGVAVSADDGDVDFEGLPAGYDFDSTRLGVRAGYTLGRVALDVLVASSDDDYDISRITGVANQTARGDTSGDTFTGMLQASLAYEWNNWRIDPQLRIGRSEADVDGYTEAGAVAMEQQIDDRTSETTYAELGVQARRDSSGGFRPSVGLYYHSEVSSDEQEVASRLVSISSVTRSMSLDVPDDDYFRLQLGGDWQWSEDFVLQFHADVSDGAERLDGWGAGLRLNYRW